MRFRPLHGDFGAEVLDFNIQSGGTPEEIEELRRAYDEYSMLLFRRGGRLAPERQVEITGWFGPPSPVDNTGQGDFVSVLHNKEMAGSMQIPFHSDLTYTDDPIRAICLQAIELPSKPTSTTYVSGTAAWNSLPPVLQEQLTGLTLQHFYQSRVPDYDWPDFIAEHPLRFVHPRTGRPILFATEHHAHRILELDEEESQALIEQLYTYLYAPDRKYEHVWQLDDLLMWDNLVLQHARTEYSDPGEGYRGLQRVALSNLTLQETIDMARARQAA